MPGPVPGTPSDVALADGTIEAARVVLGALDGKSVPALVSPAALYSLVMMVITAIRASVIAAGRDEDDEAAQDAYMRRWLEGMLEGATWIAQGFGSETSADG